MSYKVIFLKSNISIYWKEGSVLELAEEHGVDIDFGDRCGHCGCCKTKLISGKVLYISKVALPEEGFFLPCVTQPITDIVIDA
ncbi:2Fe-2S iron-sulfur cluster-binding protein [Candidatus Uabimicrobium sp. HlEnr_7]|uniref:2Fe-2S iron-sulfur cluster-binding protein n=1 Tax=Candidatus Uabimicrobium helgolandensis TaxID=3095367 RepID=UPI003556C03F